MTEPAGIVIVGSLNMDLVVRVNGLPKAGQSVMCVARFGAQTSIPARAEVNEWWSAK